MHKSHVCMHRLVVFRLLQGYWSWRIKEGLLGLKNEGHFLVRRTILSSIALSCNAMFLSTHPLASL